VSGACPGCALAPLARCSPTRRIDIFTDRFDAYARISVIFSGGEANVMSFLSLGETSNLTTGTKITVGIDGRWPLWVDLTQPGPTYNGH